jgi:1-acyl-sn-glycerol-3-phosphate acyltransferase
MSMSSSVQEYVAKQPGFARRRGIVRGLIRFIAFKVLCDVQVTGTENVPDGGPGILMMSHMSLIDPILCIGAVTNRFVIPMSKSENLDNPFFAPLVKLWGAYAINRSEIDRKALVNSIELLKSGQLILIAPEGTRQDNGLAQPKDGLAYVATKANAVIIPAAIAGARDWDKRLKRLQRPHIHMCFGRPFRFKTGDSPRVSRDALSAMTDEAMYQLALAMPDPSLRGLYSDVSKATTEHLEFVNPRVNVP